MPSYTDVFGGQNIFPAQLSLLQLDITANVELAWPTEQAIPGAEVFADIIEVDATAGLSITMPDAQNAANGQSTLINNIGAFTVSILDNDGNNIGSVASGEVWQFYLADNTTAAGTWRTFEFGAGVSTAVAAALAGAGLKAITTTLNVKILPTVTAVTPTSILNADRAEAFIWSGGVGTFNLPDPATVGTDWFVYIRNGGTGNLTVTPAAGLINGAASLTFEAGFSAIVLTDGTDYYTIGFPASLSSLFDFTSINVAGAAGNYVLGGSELNRISYRFTGVLTGNRTVIVPATVQQYWSDNQTSGAFTLTVKTLAGTGITVQQGEARILYCDGTNVVAGEETWTDDLVQGDLVYGSGAGTIARLAKSAVASRYLANTGSSNNPAWDQVNLANGVTGLLPFANFADGSALSVFGRSANTPGVQASIVGTANQALRVNSAGNALGFGAINLASADAVTGTLGVTNGGTGLATFAQGDLIYASAANVLSALAKNATFFRVLANTGTDNNPAWLLPQFAGNSQFSGNTTAALSDGWRVLYHDSATPHTLTIPANGSVAFEIGTFLGFSNPSASGALTISIDGPDTITGHGNADTTGTVIVIPPGYGGYLIKILSTKWLLVTDAPPTAATEIVYAGYVDATAAAEQVPSGWSVVQNSTGNYTVTHNLGLSTANDLSVVILQIGTGNSMVVITAVATNSFTYQTFNAAGNTNQDNEVFFLAKRNV